MDIKVDDLARLIAKELEDYSEEIEEIVKETIEEVAKDTLNSLKNDPVVKSLDGTGKYAKSFYIKKKKKKLKINFWRENEKLF